MFVSTELDVSLITQKEVTCPCFRIVRYKVKSTILNSKPKTESYCYWTWKKIQLHTSFYITKIFFPVTLGLFLPKHSDHAEGDVYIVGFSFQGYEILLHVLYFSCVCLISVQCVKLFYYQIDSRPDSSSQSIQWLLHDRFRKRQNRVATITGHSTVVYVKWHALEMLSVAGAQANAIFVVKKEKADDLCRLNLWIWSLLNFLQKAILLKRTHIWKQNLLNDDLQRTIRL